MANLQVDTAKVKSQAAQLEQTVADLQQHESRVESIAAELASELQGQTGSAVQSALSQYRDAMSALRTEQSEIVQKMYSAAGLYATEDAQASSLVKAMEI